MLKYSEITVWRVIFDQWPKLHLGLDALSNQKILKGVYLLSLPKQNTNEMWASLFVLVNGLLEKRKEKQINCEFWEKSFICVGKSSRQPLPTIIGSMIKCHTLNIKYISLGIAYTANIYSGNLDTRKKCKSYKYLP